MLAIVPWWTAAGVGVRLGMRPEESLSHVAGFVGSASLR
jgi:hypothetical protein